MKSPVQGFSKLTKEEKINWIATNYTNNSDTTLKILKQYWNTDAGLHDYQLLPPFRDCT